MLNSHEQAEYNEVVFSNEHFSVTHLISLLLMNITQFYFSVPSMLLILYKNFHSCKFKICRWISTTAHRITPISDLTASNQENNPGILVKIRCWHNWVHLIYKIFFFSSRTTAKQNVQIRTPASLLREIIFLACGKIYVKLLFLL